MTTSTARSDAFIGSKREQARLATLRSQYILDGPAETAFETLAHMARLVTGASVALVSLIDDDRQIFKAACGIDLESTPREISFCSHAVEANEILEVCDALGDPRFRMNPLVQQDPKIRYYLGVPIRGFNGLPIGTLCVIDDKPRLPLRSTELDGIVRLAGCVESLMEQGRQIRMRQAQLRDIECETAEVESTLESQVKQIANTVSAVRAAFTDIEAALEDGNDEPGIRRAITAGREATKPFLEDENVSAKTWQNIVENVAENLVSSARDRHISIDRSARPVNSGEPPKRASGIVEEVARAAVDASPEGATVGLRLKSDPYFVCVSIYRENGGLQIVKPGQRTRTDLHETTQMATEAMIAVGGYLESKPWTGGTVVRLWFPRTGIGFGSGANPA